MVERRLINLDNLLAFNMTILKYSEVFDVQYLLDDILHTVNKKYQFLMNP